MLGSGHAITTSYMWCSKLFFIDRRRVQTMIAIPLPYSRVITLVLYTTLPKYLSSFRQELKRESLCHHVKTSKNECEIYDNYSNFYKSNAKFTAANVLSDSPTPFCLDIIMHAGHTYPLRSVDIGFIVHCISYCKGSRWTLHDDVIKWKRFPRHWPFVRETHRSPVNSPHKTSDAEF